MQKLITISLLLLPFLLSAQSNLVNNGAIIKVSTGVDFRVEQGNIRNDNSGTIANEGNIYLDGNFNQVNSATYNGGVASWLWFEGAANENATGDAPLNIARLRVDNGNRLILGNHVNVSTDVDLTNNGNIQLGNFNLVVASGGTIANYNNANYVITNGTGYLQQEVAASAVFFPVGNSIYNPATLTNAGTTDNFQARVEDFVRSDYPAGTVETDGVVGKAWFIEEETVGGSDVTMTLQWETSDELPNFDRTISGISHWTGTTWDRSPTWNAATNVALTSWTQTRANITSFSPFAVEDLQMDLPVELLSFDATRKNRDEVQLDWSTASELNNNGFEVERMLENENEFQQIAFVAGNGTTSNTSYYELLDDNSYTGISYYRLKQVDFDGTSSYSPIRAVVGEQGSITFGATIFPNPVEDVLKVRFAELPVGVSSAQFKILGINGQLIQSYTSSVQAYQLIEIQSVKDLVPASYILSVRLDNGDEYLEKFVKKE